ncbi:NfrA family protein [Trinickia dinghuensis]|uniref:Bacteriophage N4 adsorption protein A n=1 Tax=Trinickia dinghuensis TaxID=2291023 RepID=A0A3D8K0H6_9BURK|nr:tetratricopeptide repeat protein [Trinickia dinghuensis]RDU98416.1 bacteriophage N4 adsorption protein A [Trinickia dinghuensis]
MSGRLNSNARFSPGTISTPPVSLKRQLRLVAQACAACFAFAQAPVHASEDRGAQPPPPLAGAAYRVAEQAYADYGQHDYAQAAALAREAIRQRPDVPELRLLLANSLAAQHRYAAASQALGDAIKVLGPRRPLVKRRGQIDAVAKAATKIARSAPAQPVPSDALTGEAFDAAHSAYLAYAAKHFANAAQNAQRAIALRPDVLRLRLLLIDSASAAGNDTLAWQADVDAVRQFGDSDDLRLRRTFIGNGLAPQASKRAFAARKAGDLSAAIAAGKEAVAYAPDNTDYRVALFDKLISAGDWPGLEAAASDAIAYDDTEVMPYVFRAYARVAQGRIEQADADLEIVFHDHDETRATLNSARAIAADIWMTQGRAKQAADRLAALKPTGDDSDAFITERLARARRQLAAEARKAPGLASARSDSARPDTTRPDVARPDAARPIVDCQNDPDFGESCDVWPADPGYAAASELERASERGDKQAAVRYAREAVAAAPDSAQHRVELIDALDDAGLTRESADEARKLIADGLFDSLPPLDAGYVALRAGDNARALAAFKQADAQGKLPASTLADVGYAAESANRDAVSARYFERAIDKLAAESRRHVRGPVKGAEAQQLEDLRAAHSEATRRWGFDVTLDYRGAGLQSGYLSAPRPVTSNSWQAGTEVYWRPFGSLGDRMLELYARGYESFGVAGGGASGADSLEAAFGVRGKPFANLDAIAAFERIVPIGSQAQGDWLARLAYSGGIGTERRVDVPSWWTLSAYAEGGHYFVHQSNYATAVLEAGRTYRVDRVSPRFTLFPYAVVGADYDSTIDSSIPVGAGVGVTGRYAFRDGRYDTLRSSIELSVQYRWKIVGDDRARGVFCSAVFSY